MQVRSPKSLPKFGQFRWDLVGPSYLASLVRYEKNVIINGFIVGDILLDKTVTIEDIIPFISKWEVLRNQRRSTRFQPMFIADWIDKEPRDLLRAKGCLLALPRNIFGEEVAQYLSELVSIVERAADAVTDNPKAVFELFSKISKIQGAALNLRGVVFELIIAHLFKLEGYQIEIRELVNSEDGARAEIDVKATNRKEVVCIECKGKGTNSLINAKEIEKWLDTPLIRIKSWLKQKSDLPETRRFEFYTSSDYTEDARDLIAQITSKHVKQTISFFSGADVLNKLRDFKETALIDVFREHFIEK